MIYRRGIVAMTYRTLIIDLEFSLIQLRCRMYVSLRQTPKNVRARGKQNRFSKNGPPFKVKGISGWERRKKNYIVVCVGFSENDG